MIGFQADRRHVGILLTLSAVLQAACLYLAPLVFECDAAMYFKYTPALTYRPPVYAAFLTLTGQHLLQSFWGTVLVQAALGVLAPLIMYRILAAAHPGAAFACALIYAASLTPFLPAKLILTEQLFTFLVLATFYALTRYYQDRRPRWLYATVACGLLATFTRWEGQIVLAGAGIAIVAAWKRQHLRHLVCAAGLVLVAFVAWSATRAYVNRDPRLFGSLHNATGDQVFYRIYRQLPQPVYLWEYPADTATPPDANRKYPPLIRPENGPATARLRELIVKIALKRGDYPDVVFLPGRGGYNTVLGGDPQRLADDVFANPDDVYVFSVPAALRTNLGAREAERLLLSVCVEAIRAHPAILLPIAGDMLSFLGLSFQPVMLQIRSLGAALQQFFMAQRGRIHYLDWPFDAGGCASATLPSAMLQEYRRDYSLTRWPSVPVFHWWASISRDWLRNSVGVGVLATWWFIGFRRNRGVFIAMAVSAAGLIATYGALGGGAQTRYEYTVLPLLMMVTTGGLMGLIAKPWGSKTGDSSVNPGITSDRRRDDDVTTAFRSVTHERRAVRRPGRPSQPT